jgi:hypothetical protein
MESVYESVLLSEEQGHFHPKLIRASTLGDSINQPFEQAAATSLIKSQSVPEILGRRELDRAITQSLFDNNLLLYYCQENCEGFVELIKDGTKIAKQEAVSPSCDDFIVTSDDGSNNHYIPKTSHPKLSYLNQSLKN